jgi:hypothetical protein
VKRGSTAALGVFALVVAQAIAAAPPTETPPADGAQAYVDQLIDGGRLAPIVATEEDDSYSNEGLPRAFRIEAIASLANGDGPDQHESGLAFGAQFETEHYGALSIEGIARTEPHGGALSIIQRGMPFDGAWIANNGVGTLYTPSIDLARSQYRFYLPTFPIAGASTEWLHDGNMQLQFAAGEPGLFDGLRLNGFDTLGGTLAMAGAQWNFARGWQAGVQVVDANGVPGIARNAGYGDLEGDIDAQSLYVAAAWRGDNSQVQVNLLQSHANDTGSANGVWIDGSTRDGRVTHNYGVFRLEPHLDFGYTPVSADLEGAYYRASYRSRQWLFDGGVDDVRSVSGDGADGQLFTGSARYQLTRDLGIGASLTWRNAGNTAHTDYLFVEQINRYGSGRLQLDSASGSGDRYDRLSASQTWDLPVGMRLTTSVFGGRETRDGERLNHAGGSLSGGGDLFGNLTWDGSLSYDRAGGSHNIGANIGASAHFGSHWSLNATYFDNRNEAIDPFATTLIPTQPTDIVRSRAVFLTLRYDAHAGTPSTPMGGARGSASGSIIGRLFLDSNDNGVQDAGEAAAASVTILLDGRFSVRTDAGGRFEFPLVAVGSHTITVVPDNLPLPWSIGDDGRRKVDVRTRETSNIEIAATRIR